MRPATEQAPTPLTPLRCPRCGAEGIGPYCSACGNVLSGRRDLSVKHFLKEAALAVTDLDSALVASFRSLFSRPGELTAEYLHGTRHRFLPPFRVFLLCNLLYFVAVDRLHFNVLTAPLAMQADEMVYRNASRGVLAKRYPQMLDQTPAHQAARDSLRTAVTTKYDGATEGLGKLIVVILIPIYAVLLQLMFVGTKRFFAEHLIFSTHFVSFLLLALPLSGLMTSGVFVLMRLGNISRVDGDETIYITLFTAMIALYVYLGQRRVYASGRLAAAARTGVVAVTVGPMIVGFKFVLFLATLAWIG